MLLFCHFPLHQRHFLLWLQLLRLLFFKGLYQCHGVNASWVTPTSPYRHTFQFSSVQSLKSCPTLCDPMHCSTPGLPCPSPTPGVHSSSQPSSWWCHPAISSSAVPFSCPQSLPASGSFPMSQLFAWGGQSTGVSALASFLAGFQPRWIQGIRSGDGVGELDTIALIKY